MIPAIVVFIYLAAVVYIGVFAFRKSKGTHGAEDYFLANRSLGTFVFLMSLFGTNMTASPSSARRATPSTTASSRSG